MADTSHNNSVETWKDIPGWEGIYQVSDMGNCRALDRRGKDGRRLPARPLRPNLGSFGYRYLCLPKDGAYKSLCVHAAVAAAFIGPRPQGMHVCHNNGKPSDNRLTNLRYDTPQGNERDKDIHGTRNPPRGERCGGAKITEQQAREILAQNGTAPQHVIAARYGISRSQVARFYGVRWPQLGARAGVIPVKLARASHPMAKLTEEKVAWIRQSYDGSNLQEMAASLGVSKSTVDKIVKGKLWPERLPSDERRKSRIVE